LRPAALIAFPWTLITGKVEFLYWIGMGLALMGARVAGARIKLVGLDKIDTAGTYIFMSNHVSNLDPPILVPLIPGRTSVLAKKRYGGFQFWARRSIWRKLFRWSAATAIQPSAVSAAPAR